MAIQRCADHSNSDNSSFSSPVPIIGLYVVGANLVCLLLITRDMYAGFRDRKRWLPCHLFSLNSLTLTLIAIATKLPVDLTTVMPSAQDQLSKLTGTVFLCICLGFFMPSLGSTTYSECMSNMASLTILVITVLVNIGVQMYTGLINSFHREHKIILCCMMLMLAALWNDESSRVDGHLIAQEVGLVIDFIEQIAYTSIKALHRGLEQMFVDMLNEHLIQLPGIILKEINESSPKELEKRVTEAFEVVSKIQPLEGLIQWPFPVGTTITSLVTEASILGADSTTLESNNNAIAVIDANANEIPITENQNGKPFEGASSMLGSIAEGNVSINVSLAKEDEIIQIE
ncbi:hypothetical protein Sjap_000325 [Stephania japonica]|uniref:Uncharacterized protein n=1 Tax=Stephania japonica TaxID=461633 RepID=A0AAP0PSC3_9MAGN